MATSGIDGYPGSNSDSNNSGGVGGSGERFRGVWDMSIVTPVGNAPAPVTATACGITLMYR